MQPLFPPIKPYATHRLDVDNGQHNLYIEECGNPAGKPVVFLHGGPGAGIDPDNRRFFDPALYRIVLFDQRGSGLSTPHASLENNTTQDLVSDIEGIRNHLGIAKWIVFGGSWGSTLALVYAETHPENVLGLILRGIFLCREQDIDWFYKEGGASRLFPDHWEAFANHLPENERSNILDNYYQRLINHDEVARMSAAKAWALWEGSCATLQPNPHVVDRFTNIHTAVSLARIEAHYFVNKIFLEPNQILNDAHKLQDIPGVIVHGRYDVVCPIDNAFALNKVWPQSELQIIRDAGHSACELGIINALVAATNQFARPKI